jgi:hypothetical protein
MKDLLQIFAAKYVQPSFRDRFVHEALKKPNKLQSRMCHSIDDIFSEDYKGLSCPFSANDSCIPITGTGIDSFKEYKWSEIENSATRGFGLLVISPDAEKFYAETEFEFGRPFIPYSSTLRRT